MNALPYFFHSLAEPKHAPFVPEEKQLLASPPFPSFTPPVPHDNLIPTAYLHARQKAFLLHPPTGVSGLARATTRQPQQVGRELTISELQVRRITMKAPSHLVGQNSNSTTALMQQQLHGAN